MNNHLRWALLATVLVVAVSAQFVSAEDDVASSDVISDREGKLFFKIIRRSTTTSFRVVMITSTVPYTCNLDPTTQGACMGRKRRRRRKRTAGEEHQLPEVNEKMAPELEGSLREKRASEPSDMKKSEARLIITSWSTVRTTFTSVSTVTTFGTTVSVSLLCTVGGINLLPTC